MPNPHSTAPKNAMWSMMALFASAVTGADVACTIAQRRSGYDPADQEEYGRALASIRDHVSDLRETLARLGIRRIAYLEESAGTPACILDRFNTLLLFGSVVRHVHRIHQRLLSLYPAADVSLIEETRVLQSDIVSFLDDQPVNFDETASRLVERGWCLVINVERLASAQRAG